MKEVKRVFKPWSAWNTIKIEKYLEEMEMKGWRVKDLSFGQMLIEFRKVPPGKTRYCVDYINKPDDEYFMLFQDDGWEMVNKFSGWVMWRKSYDAESRPSLYTDNESLVERNARVIKILGFALLAQVPAGFINANNVLTNNLLGRITGPLKLLLFTYILAVLIILYAFTRMILWNKILKKSLY